MKYLIVFSVLFTYVYCTVDQAEFQIDALRAHNKYRKAHGVPVLVLNNELSNIAQSFAEKLATEIKGLDTSNNNYRGVKLGENLALAAGFDKYTGEDVTNLWYRGNDEYDYDKGEFSVKTGAFTQLVWKNSTDVGFGIYETGDGEQTYVVANYYPPGNVENYFKLNVFKRRYEPRRKPKDTAIADFFQNIKDSVSNFNISQIFGK